MQADQAVMMTLASLKAAAKEEAIKVIVGLEQSKQAQLHNIAGSTSMPHRALLQAELAQIIQQLDFIWPDVAV